MKKTVQFFAFLVGLLLILPIALSAQDKKTKEITVTITEDGEVVTDTTFAIKEGQDPNALKEIISHIAGADIDVKMMKKEKQKFIYTHGDKEGHAWHIEEIDLDSIKEAHGGEHVMVFVSEDGHMHITETDDMEEVKVIKDEDSGTVTVKVKKESGEEGEKTIIIKSIGEDEDCEGGKKMIILESDDDAEFIDEDDLEWVEVKTEENEDGSVKVYITKSDDGTKVVKKVVKVKVNEEGEETEEEEKEVKKGKKIE